MNPDGLPTSYHFQYGTSTGYGTRTASAPVGNGTIALKFSATISSLQPAATYHYRIVANNSDGTVDGRDRTFTTASIPLSIQVAAVPNPTVFGNPFVIEGHVSGTGAVGHEVALQVNPYPYLTGFKDIGNPELTNAAGGFSFPYIDLLENTQVRVVTVGRREVSSVPLLEGCAVRVSFHVRRTHRRGFVRLYGTVTPAEVGALVGFQLMRHGPSLNMGGTVVKRGTATVARFSRIVRLHRRGVYRALVGSTDGAHVAGYSEPIRIR